MTELAQESGRLAQDSGSSPADTLDQLSGLTLSDWLWAAGLIVVAGLLSLLVRRLVGKALRSSTGAFAARLLARLAAALVFLIGFIYALNQVGVSIGPLLGILGVVGLAFAFAFQEILANFIAGVLLILRKPFSMGDQISTADYEGTIEDVSLRAVALRTFDGVRVYVPNSTVWNNPIVNFTELGARRTTLPVGVAYDTDLEAARSTILDAVRSVDGVAAEPEPEAFVHEFGGSSIAFAVRFWHEPAIAVEWRVRDAVARGVKRAFDDAGIEIPFPQRVVTFAGGGQAASHVPTGG